MKGVAYILFLLWGTALTAQRPVQTIVPLQPITVGAAFQVQYIVTAGEAVVELQSPAFGRDFRFVSGPRLYQGQALINNTKIPVQNFSYTLIPLRKGRLIVKGATVVFKSGKKKSDDTFIVVTDGQSSDGAAATPVADLPRLAQGDAGPVTLHHHIFIKAAVSRQSCFVGEPVEVTFTLFSRLPSASEIIKNPGFYGFSVLDMPDAAEGQETVQTHNGTFYNTHTLRHVQLYPMQPGNLVLDKMSVANAIEFADSASGAPVQTTVLLESPPLALSVKPLPATTHENFSGAVGTFSINAQVEKQEWPQNMSGKLRLTIKGAGNFLQLSAPEIDWPKGIDVFEPAITERLQKDAVPVAGTRTYTYTFTADSTGAYTIPPVAFTYFNPSQKRYKTVHTGRLHFTVRQGSPRAALPREVRIEPSRPASFAGLLAAAALIVMALLLLKKYRSPKKDSTGPIVKQDAPDFEKAVRDISPAEKDAYRQLQQALMGFLKSWGLQADAMQRGTAQPVAAGLPTGRKKELQAILEECEAVQYYNAAPTVSFSTLQQQALHFMQSVKDRE